MHTPTLSQHRREKGERKKFEFSSSFASSRQTKKKKELIIIGAELGLSPGGLRKKKKERGRGYAFVNCFLLEAEKKGIC